MFAMLAEFRMFDVKVGNKFQHSTVLKTRKQPYFLSTLYLGSNVLCTDVTLIELRKDLSSFLSAALNNFVIIRSSIMRTN